MFKPFFAVSCARDGELLHAFKMHAGSVLCKSVADNAAGETARNPNRRLKINTVFFFVFVTRTASDRSFVFFLFYILVNLLRTIVYLKI